MNLKYKIYQLALLGITVFLLGSCSDDFLEKEKLGEETSEVYFSSEEKAIGAVNAAYSDMKDHRFGWALWAFGETLSDNAIYGGSDGDNSSFAQLKEFNSDPSHRLVKYKWQVCYRGVSKASLALEGIQQMDPALFKTDKMQARLIAEARFLRAFYHFEMARVFGRIPVVDHVIKSPDEKISRSEIEDVFKFVTDELILAEQDLWQKDEYEAKELGRITKGTAQAILAKAFLYVKDYTNAKKWALQVITDGKYELDPDFAHIFSFDGEHGMESIFELSFYESSTETSAYKNNGNFQTLFMLPRNITYGYGINLPTEDLKDAYLAANDQVRFKATMLGAETVYEIELADLYTALENANTGGDPTAIAEAEAALQAGKDKLLFNRTGFYQHKMYVNPAERAAGIKNNGNNIRMMRYADVFLMYAEACAKTGEEGVALEYLKKVRSRVGLTTTNLSGNALFDAIIEERRLELAGENERYHDLVRTGKATILPGWTESKKYWPVPQSEVDRTSGELE